MRRGRRAREAGSGRGGVAVRLGEGRAERRRLVLEDRDVVAATGSRSGSSASAARAGRARRAGGTRGSGARRRPRSSRRSGRRGASSPSRGAGRAFGRRRDALFAQRRARVVEVDQLTTVGEVCQALDDAGTEGLGGGGASRTPACSRQHGNPFAMLSSTHLAFPVTRRRCGASSVDGRCRGPRRGVGADRLAGRQRQPAGRPRDPCAGSSRRWHASATGRTAPRGRSAPAVRRPIGLVASTLASDRQFAHAAGGRGCRRRPRLRGRGRDPRWRIRSRRRLRAPARSGRRRRDRPERGDRVGFGMPRPPPTSRWSSSTLRATSGSAVVVDRPRRRSARCDGASAGPRTCVGPPRRRAPRLFRRRGARTRVARGARRRRDRGARRCARGLECGIRSLGRRGARGGSGRDGRVLRERPDGPRCASGLR